MTATHTSEGQTLRLAVENMTFTALACRSSCGSCG